MVHHSFQTEKPLLRESPHGRDSTAVDGLPLGNAHPHGFRAFFRLASRVLAEIRLYVQPIGAAPGSIEQDEDDRHQLQHPEVVIAHVQIEQEIHSAPPHVSAALSWTKKNPGSTYPSRSYVITLKS